MAAMAAMPDEVVLLGYPVHLGAEQQEHMDGVVREFQLIALSDPDYRAQVPGRLLRLVELLTSTYGADLAEPARLREQALHAGLPTVDLRYPVRPETRSVVDAYRDVLNEVDAFCRADELLVLARPPEVVALQEWVFAEFHRQLDGKEPCAWPGPV